jgi:hypothetical protein
MRNVLITSVLTAFVGSPALAAVSPSATIVGTVTLTAADGGTFAGEGARVVLACGAEKTTRTEVADEHGAFRFLNVPVGSCSIEADVQGFHAPAVSVVTAADQAVGADLHLSIVPLRVGVNAVGTPFQELRVLSRSRPAGRWQRERAAKACARRLRQPRRLSFLKKGCDHVTSND